MFDIGFFELALIGIIALLVLGPEKMPEAVRLSGALVARIKRTLIETKLQIEEEIQLQEHKKRVAEHKDEFHKTFKEAEASIENPKR